MADTQTDPKTEVTESLAGDEQPATASPPPTPSSPPEVPQSEATNADPSKPPEATAPPAAEEPIKHDQPIDAEVVSLGAGVEAAKPEESYVVPPSSEPLPTEPTVTTPDQSAKKIDTPALAKSATLAIVAAIIVAMALIGLSYAVFLRADNDLDQDQSTSNQIQADDSQTSTETPAATETLNQSDIQAEVDQLNQSAAEQSDDADFDATPLTDTSLELE